MQTLLIFSTGCLSAILIKTLFAFISLYCNSKWGSIGLHASMSIEVYIIMMIGYLSFKPIFSKNAKED